MNFVIRRPTPFGDVRAVKAFGSVLRRIPSHPNTPIATILVVATFARFSGLAFGLPHPYCRPDETSIASVATAFYHGDLNPHFFNYPAFFMLTVAVTLRLWVKVGWLLGYLRGPSAMEAIITTTTVHYTARILSAAAGVASVWLIFRIALRLFDRSTALVAAAFLALAFLHVRDSHFGVTDVPATFLALAAFYFITSLKQSACTHDLVATAMMVGLAVSTKYNLALIAVPAIVIILTERRQRMAGRLWRATLFFVLVATVFVATSPYTILEWRDFSSAIAFESAHLRGGHGPMLGRGWIVHLTTTLRYGLGVPLLAASLWGLVYLILREPGKGLLIASFPVPYFALLGGGYTVFARYMIPIVPFLCLTAAYAVVKLALLTVERAGRPAWANAMLSVLACLALVPSVDSVIDFDRLIGRTDNRLIAASWIQRHFPEGATISQFGSTGGLVFVAIDDTDKSRLYVNIDDRRLASEPDVVVVQSSPLLDAPDLTAATSVIESRYELRANLAVVTPDSNRVYDRQDEFYLPLAGFNNIVRPGPNLAIYVRR